MIYWEDSCTFILESTDFGEEEFEFHSVGKRVCIENGNSRVDDPNDFAIHSTLLSTNIGPDEIYFHK